MNNEPKEKFSYIDSLSHLALRPIINNSPYWAIYLISVFGEPKELEKDTNYSLLANRMSYWSRKIKEEVIQQPNPQEPSQ